MGKAKSGSRKSTPAIEILGVNEQTSSVFFRQGARLFTASQKLGWTPSCENPPLKLRGNTRKPNKYRAITQVVIKSLRQPTAPLAQVGRIFARGQFHPPTNGLRILFATTQKMSRAYELPADMKAALERHLALM